MHDSGCELHQSHSKFPSGSQQTESSFNPQNYDLEDFQRDVPQALLFPHSLDTAAPGRQVLLRHQRVILAPPTPPPSMAGTSERENVDEKQGGVMHVKMERFKRWWISLKKRASPKLFPQAWLLFLIIILIAVGAVVTGWGGLAAETVRHQTLTRPAGSSATSAARPAPPNLEASASTITSSGLAWYNPTGYGTAMTAEGTVWSPRSTWTVTGHAVTYPRENLTTTHHRASIHDHAVKKEIITDYEITHVTSVVTQWVTSYVTAITVETTSHHGDAGAGLSTLSTTSVSSDSRITAAPTSENRKFCPDPNHPGAWTLCASDHEATSIDSVLSSSAVESSASSSCLFNPFTLINTILKGIWKLLFHHEEARTEALRRVHRYKVFELGCKCGDLERLMLVMVDIIEMQQGMLEIKDELIRSQKTTIEDQTALIYWNKGVFDDMVGFVAGLRNQTTKMDAIKNGTLGFDVMGEVTKGNGTAKGV